MLKAEEKHQEIYRSLQTISGSMQTLHHGQVSGIKAVARVRYPIQYASEKERLESAIEYLQSW